MNILATKELELTDLVTDNIGNGRKEEKSVLVLIILYYGTQFR